MVKACRKYFKNVVGIFSEVFVTIGCSCVFGSADFLADFHVPYFRASFSPADFSCGFLPCGLPARTFSCGVVVRFSSADFPCEFPPRGFVVRICAARVFRAHVSCGFSSAICSCGFGFSTTHHCSLAARARPWAHTRRESDPASVLPLLCVLVSLRCA